MNSENDHQKIKEKIISVNRIHMAAPNIIVIFIIFFYLYTCKSKFRFCFNAVNINH
jgi:hypothetical protein